MAIYTLTANTYFDQIGTLFPACPSITGDSFVVDNGATLTIRQSNSSASAFPRGLTAQYGTLLFTTTGVNQNLLFFFATTANVASGLASKNAGIVKVKGQWIDLIPAASNAGTANMTFYDGMWFQQFPPMVRIETGQNTNQWLSYCNNGISGSVGWNGAPPAPGATNAGGIAQARALSSNGSNFAHSGSAGGFGSGYIGSGTSLGRFFEWTPSLTSIRFGNGVTGNIPSASARIQVPSIHFAVCGAWVNAIGSRLELGSQNTGTIDLECCQFTDRWRFNLAQPKSVCAIDVGIPTNFTMSECYDVTISGLVVAPEREASGYASGTQANTGSTTARIAAVSQGLIWSNLAIKKFDASFITAYAHDAASFTAIDPITIRDSTFYVIQRVTATDDAVVAATCNNLRFYNCIGVGGDFSFTTCVGITLTALQWSQNSTGLTGNMLAASVYRGQPTINLVTSFNTLLINLTHIGPISGSYLYSQGHAGASRTSVVAMGNNCAGFKWINNGIELYGSSALPLLCSFGTFAKDIYLAKIPIRNMGAGSQFWTDTNAVLNLYVRNVTASGWVAAANGEDSRSWNALTNMGQAINGEFKMMSGTTSGMPMAFTAAYDIPFWQLIGGKNFVPAVGGYASTGSIGITMTPPVGRNYWRTLSGSPYFNNLGGLVHRIVGDVSEFTWDWKILGIDSFSACSAMGTAAFPYSRYGIFGTAAGMTSWRNSVQCDYAIRPATSTTYSDYFRIDSLSAYALPLSSAGFYMKVRFTTTATCSGITTTFGANAVSAVTSAPEWTQYNLSACPGNIRPLRTNFCPPLVNVGTPFGGTVRENPVLSDHPAETVGANQNTRGMSGAITASWSAIATAYTIGFWFRLTSTGGVQTFFSKATGTFGVWNHPYAFINIALSGGNLMWSTLSATDLATAVYHSVSAATNVVPNKWHHAAFAWSTTGGNKNMYFNGVAVTSQPSNVGLSANIGTSGVFYLARDGYQVSPVHTITGAMEEVVMFNRELSATEIRTLTASTFENQPLTADGMLEFFYDFDSYTWLQGSASSWVTTNNAESGISGWWVNALTNIAAQYPVGTVALTIANVVTGSQIWAKLNSNNEIIANETITGTTDNVDYVYQVPYDFDFSNPTVTVRVRKATSTPKYIPFETIGSYNEQGGSVYVSQVLDTINT